MTKKIALIALCCTVFALTATASAAADDFAYVSLGSGRDLDGNQVTANFAAGVNDYEVVTLADGTSSGITPYVWANGTFYPLPTLPGYPRTEAVQINDKNQVMGWGQRPTDDGMRAMFWSYNEEVGWDVHDLGSLESDCGGGATGPCDTSSPTGLNDSGQVVGSSDEYECISSAQCNNVPEPFVSDVGGPLEAIYQNPSGSLALAIDDAGDVAVTTSYGADSTTLEPAGTVLPFYVTALSSNGKFAVGVDTKNGDAERWSAATGQTSMLSPLEGDEFATVAAVDDVGEAAGSSAPASGESGAHAVVWPDNAPTDPVDLNGVVPEGTPTLYFATGIGNNGAVVGGGQHEGLSDPGPPWLLTPDLTVAGSGELPEATVGEHYSYTFSAATGTAPYTWSIDPLPAGLTLNPSSGVLSGVPTEAGTYTMQVTVQDSGNPQQESTRNVTLEVLGGGEGASAEGSGTFNDDSVTITEKCPAGTPGGCAGSVEVEAPGGGSSAHVAANKRSKLVVLAKGKFSIMAGHSKKLVLRLTKKGRALLKGKHKLTVTVLTTTKIAGKKDVRRAKVKLKRKRHRR